MNLIILSDFDGTVLRIDTCEFILDRFSQEDWRAFDRQLEKGEITLEECLRKQFKTVRVSKAQILREIDQVASVTPCFDKLLEYSKKHEIPVVLVSAGLDFVIKHILKREGWQEFVNIYAPKARVIANGIKFNFPALIDQSSVNFKQDLAKHYRKQGKKVVYIGDGLADFEAAASADLTFAIKNSKLAELLRREGIGHREISDFSDVVEAIDQAFPSV